MLLLWSVLLYNRKGFCYKNLIWNLNYYCIFLQHGMRFYGSNFHQHKPNPYYAKYSKIHASVIWNVFISWNCALQKKKTRSVLTNEWNSVWIVKTGSSWGFCLFSSWVLWTEKLLLFSQETWNSSDETWVNHKYLSIDIIYK